MLSKNSVPISSGINNSIWIDQIKPLEFEKAKSNASFDVVIVGGGIAGLSVAYQLAKARKKVAVVESRLIGGGESGRTTAHIVNALDDRYYEILKLAGKDDTCLTCGSHTSAIDMIEKIIREEKINCDFERVPGYLFLSEKDDKEILEKELEALNEIGVEGVKIVNNPEGLKLGPALLFPNQGQFHIMKYLRGLTESLKIMGVKIYTSTHASEITEKGVKTQDGVFLKAKAIAVCTNSPVNDRVTMHTKQAPYRTYVIAALCKKDAYKALFWDTAEEENHWPYPYHYIRSAKYDQKNDVIIIGGEDHKTGQAFDMEKRFKDLEKWGRKHFKFGKVAYKWSGQVLEPFDSLAFIGKNPGNENIYIATGDSGNGMTHGTIAGMLISDLILGKENPWEKLYDPRRKPYKNLGTFAKENLNVAKQYADFLSTSNNKQLKMHEGAVIDKDSKKIAIYKDEKGVHSFSAVCPHLGCVVRWNSGEKSFDCPCHGSRFTSHGRVVNGPANANLEKKKGK